MQYYPLQLYLWLSCHIQTFHLDYIYILYTILGEETQTQKTRFCEFIHCREVLQTSESSLMLEHGWWCTTITGMDLVSFSYIIHWSTIAGQHTGTNYELYNSTIVNFNLPLLYIIFTKINGTTMYFYLLILWDRSRKRVDEDIARMSGEYVAITVILDRSENFYISPWMQCINILLLSSRIGLTTQQADITQSILAWQTWQDLYSLARSRLAWKKYSSKVPASVRG